MLRVPATSCSSLAQRARGPRRRTPGTGGVALLRKRWVGSQPRLRPQRQGGPRHRRQPRAGAGHGPGPSPPPGPTWWSPVSRKPSTPAEAVRGGGRRSQRTPRAGRWACNVSATGTSSTPSGRDRRLRRLRCRSDVLVNNAGHVASVPRHVTEVTEAMWDKVMDLNLKGVFRLTAIVGSADGGDADPELDRSSTCRARGPIRPNADDPPLRGGQGGRELLTVGFAKAFGPKVRVNLHHGRALPHRRHQGVGHGRVRTRRPRASPCSDPDSPTRWWGPPCTSPVTPPSFTTGQLAGSTVASPDATAAPRKAAAPSGPVGSVRTASGPALAGCRGARSSQDLSRRDLPRPRRSEPLRPVDLGKLRRWPERGGHSISNMLLVVTVVSRSPCTAQACTRFPPPDAPRRDRAEGRAAPRGPTPRRTPLRRARRDRRPRRTRPWGSTTPRHPCAPVTRTHSGHRCFTLRRRRVGPVVAR